MFQNLLLFLVGTVARAAVVQLGPTFGAQNDTTPYPKNILLEKRDSTTDPTDFRWLKRWAAVGDSYTAGIGSGSALIWWPWSTDWKCSRYDHSYPVLVNNFLGSSVDDFQYTACSGDRSVQIINQIQNLKGNLDAVLLTAGGNDLCLVSPILIKAELDESSTLIT
jgi:lysophospholipase L1-like esterase